MASLDRGRALDRGRTWRSASPVVKWDYSSYVWRVIPLLAIPVVTDSQAAEPSKAQFPTTHWSQVVAAGNASTPEARAALAALCAAYWYPLYAFVRRRGHDSHSAEDIVQGFFAALLEKDGLTSVDRTKGRFRSFMVASCSHFLANRLDYERALKRGRDEVIVPIDRLAAETRYGREPVHDLTPDRLFDRRWATTLLDHVLARLEAEMCSAGKERQFEVLRPALLGSSEKIAYARVAELLGCSEGAARAAAHRLRARYRALLRTEVARTLDDSSTVDDEIRELFATFSD
jgi:RNA polymerase sigma factor (sigma-70 family)